jgi:hypothetical protein
MLRDSDPSLDYEIIGMGGVMEASDAHALLAVGADAVQTASAASVNPGIAADLATGISGDPGRDAEIVQQIRDTLYAERGGFRSPAELAELLGLDVDAVERELNPLGDLDLPKRVFEIVALGLPDRPRSVIDPEVWGHAPSPAAMREIEAHGRHLVSEQQQRMVRGAATPEDFGQQWGQDAEQVAQALAAGRLVYFEWAGRQMIPVWQLKEDGTLLPGLPELRRAFARDPVALDVWMSTPNPTLSGRTPRQALLAGDTATVLNSIAAIGAGL